MTKGAAHQLNYPGDFAVDFSADAFDQAIQDKGIPFQHSIALPCPLGKTDVGDYRKPHADHGSCSNGFLYREAGTIMTLFSGNSLQMIQVDLGLLTGSSVSVSFDRFYQPIREGVEPEPFYAATFDRFYLPDENIVVTTTEMFEPSGAPQDRLHFPVVRVVALIDANGIEYSQVAGDFSVVEGKIQWGKKSPLFNVEKSRGIPCSIRYLYRPYYLLKTMQHEVRVSQTEDFAGNRILTRLPQGAILQRENVFENQDKDNTTSSDRQVKGPSTLNLGPR